jgi:hypothetical protein
METVAFYCYRFIWLQQNIIKRLKRRVWNLALFKMEVILPNFLRQHKSHDAWWYFIKKKRNATPKDTIKPPKDKVDKPNKYFLSELLQISMEELWEVLIVCRLTKSAGKREGIIGQRKLASLIITHNLGDIVALNEKGKQSVMQIGVYGNKSTANSDHCPTTEWKSGKKQPRPLRDASNKFREDLKNFKLEKEKLLIQVHTATLGNTDGVPPVIKSALPIKTVPPSPQPSIEKDADPQMKIIKAFLSKILASPDVMKDPSFFKDGVGSSTIGDLLQQTAAETEKKKAGDKKIEEAISAALRVELF